MSESLTLTTPISGPSTTSYRVSKLNLRRIPNPVIVVEVIDNNGLESQFMYEGDTARTFLNSLNTMNFSVTSLEKRVLQRLSTDGFIVGTVSGTPGD